MDYFGNLLATCSSDGTVKVFNILEDPVKLIGTLSGYGLHGMEEPAYQHFHRHKGPVWRVAWAHPMHGTMLASCSFDGTVIIWKNEGSAWWIIWENEVHSMSGRPPANTTSQFSDHLQSILLPGRLSSMASYLRQRVLMEKCLWLLVEVSGLARAGCD